MEYVFLAFVVWFILCLPAIIYARIVDNRRRDDAESAEGRLKALERQIELLAHRLKEVTSPAVMEKSAAPAAALPPSACPWATSII